MRTKLRQQSLEIKVVKVHDGNDAFGPSQIGRDVHVRSNRRRVAHLSRLALQFIYIVSEGYCTLFVLLTWTGFQVA